MTASPRVQTMRAAVMALRERGVAACAVGPCRVGAPDTCAEFLHEVDELVCTLTPSDFKGRSGNSIRTFSQTTDAEVRELVARAAEERP